MQFDEVMLGRRSIRGYKPDPVPRALIEEVLTMAMRAPTSMNTQPWNFYVITGEPLARIRQGNTERILAGVPDSREFRKGEPFGGVHRERQIGVAKQLFSAMGIARDDAAMRQDWVLRGFRQFDAPVCVIVTYDRALDGSDDAPFDCGAVATALVNAAWSRGLGARSSTARASCNRPWCANMPGFADGSDHPQKHRAGLAGRKLSRQRRGFRAQIRGRGGDVCGVRGSVTPS